MKGDIPMCLIRMPSQPARLQLRVKTQKAPNKEGCLDLLFFFAEVFITGEAVKNSSLVLQTGR